MALNLECSKVERMLGILVLVLITSHSWLLACQLSELEAAVVLLRELTDSQLALLEAATEPLIKSPDSNNAVQLAQYEAKVREIDTNVSQLVTSLEKNVAKDDLWARLVLSYFFTLSIGLAIGFHHYGYF